MPPFAVRPRSNDAALVADDLRSKAQESPGSRVALRVLAWGIAVASAWGQPLYAQGSAIASEPASGKPSGASSEIEGEPAPGGDVEESSEEASVDGESAEVVYDLVTVVGRGARAERAPGSAHVITEVELEKFQYEDVHRILRQVPGVNIQEEDGYGLRPNIGLRGTGVERSQKITLLEDGVPIAPAPYAAPSAYYSPTAGRMESFEIRKGSAAIRQGPQTQGGVINYVSSSIPGEVGGRIEASGGDHGTFKLRAAGGGSWEQIGFLLETYQYTTEGFKDLDGGGDTGFDLSDYLAKVRWSSSAQASLEHSLELKLGRTEQQGDETYLGLTAADFAATPFRRYVGSQADDIDTEHDQIMLRWLARPAQNVDLTVTAYRNDFFRDWYKNESTLGVSNRSLLSSPQAFPEALAVLRGEVDSADDALKLRHNRRDYYSQGLQASLAWRPEWVGRVRHTFELGVRWHEDEEDRLQEEDGWAVRGGQMVRTSFGVSGSQANRIGTAEALALFVQDEISFGRLTLTPGLRFESVDLQRLDFGKSDPNRTGVSLKTRQNSLDAWMPGLGLHLDLGQGWGLVAGVHRGYAPPSPSSTEEVDPEESVNWEIGVRQVSAGSSFEAVAFWSDYSNLLGTDTVSGGGTGTGDQFNGGAADVYGLELGWSKTLFQSSTVRVPVRFTYTYTQAEFSNSFETSFADWSPEVREGDELPYLPEHQAHAEIGLERGPFQIFLAANQVSEMRTSAGQGEIPADERIEEHLTFDLSAAYEIAERYRLLVNVRNLGNETYVAARRPYGLRPGLSRTMTAGISIRF